MEKHINKVLELLNNNGFEAYLVGGYVRDALLGIVTYDADICTNALPKDIHSLFNSSKSNYGSVNLKVDKFNIDITTFRKDLNYVNRKPSEVIYIDSLEEDLKRRDFTINAICMDKDEKVIDLLNGNKDLSDRIIRMIGNPDIRLKEDPLRILRAIRFATLLDFSIDQELFDSIKKNNELVSTLSRVRIREELDKILSSKNFLKGLNLLKETGIDKIINISWNYINYVEDINGMWAQINTIDIPFTNNEKSNIIKITEIVNEGKIDNKTLFKYGLYVCNIASRILNINYNDVTEMYENIPIKGKDDLDISSDEISLIVGNGKVIGDAYNKIIDLVLENKLNNNNESIKKYLMDEWK